MSKFLAGKSKINRKQKILKAGNDVMNDVFILFNDSQGSIKYILEIPSCVFNVS